MIKPQWNRYPKSSFNRSRSDDHLSKLDDWMLVEILIDFFELHIFILWSWVLVWIALKLRLRFGEAAFSFFSFFFFFFFFHAFLEECGYCSMNSAWTVATNVDFSPWIVHLCTVYGSTNFTFQQLFH